MLTNFGKSIIWLFLTFKSIQNFRLTHTEVQWWQQIILNGKICLQIALISEFLVLGLYSYNFCKHIPIPVFMHQYILIDKRHGPVLTRSLRLTEFRITACIVEICSSLVPIIHNTQMNCCLIGQVPTFFLPSWTHSECSWNRSVPQLKMVMVVQSLYISSLEKGHF